MREIFLTRGKVAKVSDEDYERLARHMWQAQLSKHTGNWYAVRVARENGKRRKIYMHREITGAPPGFIVDHADRDTLNNQRWNLRLCSGSFNNANRELGDSGYRGVSWERGRYRARLHFDGEALHLGMFATPEIAAMVHDIAAVSVYGEFAWRNFPPEREPEEEPAEIPF